MRVSNYTKESLSVELINRIKDIDSRERIVLKMPFGHEVNRVEIYCGETEVKGNNEWFGKKFTYVVTLQQFNDYTNKPIAKSSYSYESELINYIPRLCDKLFNSIS
jgi:hypothetical protein